MKNDEKGKKKIMKNYETEKKKKKKSPLDDISPLIC